MFSFKMSFAICNPYLMASNSATTGSPLPNSLLQAYRILSLLEFQMTHPKAKALSLKYPASIWIEARSLWAKGKGKDLQLFKL